MKTLLTLMTLCLALVSGASGQEFDVKAQAKTLLDEDRPEALVILFNDCRKHFTTDLGYVEAIKTISIEIAAHTKSGRHGYSAMQNAAATVLATASPDVVRSSYRLALCLTRTGPYLRDLAPEEWRAIRQRTCVLLAAFARRLAFLTDPTFDSAKSPAFKPPEGITLPPDSSGEPAAAETVHPAMRAAYIKAVNDYQASLLHYRQQVQIRSVWFSFRKDLVTYLINSHVRHPTDYYQLTAFITLCGLDEEREAIVTDVAKTSGVPLPPELQQNSRSTVSP